MRLSGNGLRSRDPAYAAASEIDGLDGHDGFNPINRHVGVAAVPTLATLEDAGAALSGREALASLIVGHEVAGRTGTSLHAAVSGDHTSGAWNALAGLSAAVLTEQGFIGAPAVTIEDPEAAPHCQDLGSFWQVEKQHVKPCPTRR